MIDRLGPYLLGPNDENQGIYTGDARELAKAIPDESVDLIFTDPVYQNIDDYRWLAETAARILRRAGNVLVFYGTQYKVQVFNTLGSHGLRYRWDFANILAAMITRHVGRIGVKVMGLAWFDRGDGNANKMIYDSQLIAPPRQPKVHPRWNKAPRTYVRYVDTFSQDRAMILDPFTGGDTVPVVCKMLGRRWLAFEIDPTTADRARQRVAQTQPPLFVPQETQLSLVGEADDSP